MTHRISTNQARQGDVLLARVPSLPADATLRPRESGRVILAHGEVTGHAHAIADAPDAPTAALLDAPDGLAYLRVDALSQLVHDEHSTIVLEPGVYRVTRQREYDDEAEFRQVAD